MEQYSRLDTVAQSAVQIDLVRVLDDAAALTGLDRSSWARQPQGDQEFAVLPEGVPEATVLGPFVRALASRLAALNAGRVPGDRMRLRLAVDFGVVADAPLGHAGPAPVSVARYVNASQLKAVLAAIESAHLAVIVSDRLYQDVVRLGHRELDPGQYVRAHIEIKEFAGYGWIHVPGHSRDELSGHVTGKIAPAVSATPRVTGSSAVSQCVQAGVAVGRDVRGGLTVGIPVPTPPPGPGYDW
ncbi:hypothetical protein [Streptomyces sp. NPDC003090]|uniref:hypothetical protein n=1 Tax=Streptomyces sp. NPDC003090 TaxID=3154274 RepID=UPI00381EF1A1